MIKTIVKVLANTFDAIALIGLDSQFEKRSKKAGIQMNIGLALLSTTTHINNN